MGESPNFFNKIDKNIVCNWFYYYYIVSAAIATICILFITGCMISKSLYGKYYNKYLWYWMALLGLAVVNTGLFFFTCKK
jgi:hypothetical protein